MPGQTVVLPVKFAGTATIEEMVIANVVLVLLPQLLSADTDSEPLPAPIVTVMLFVVDVPVQPDGNVHV